MNTAQSRTIRIVLLLGLAQSGLLILAGCASADRRSSANLLPPDMRVAAGVRVERIFGPESPGRYKHPASITELADGDLYLVYFGGSGEYAPDTAVYGSRLASGADAT